MRSAEKISNRQYGLHTNGSRCHGTDVTPEQRKRYLAVSTRCNELMSKGVKANNAWRLAVLEVTGCTVNTTLTGH